MPTLDVRKHAGKEQIRGALRYDAKALLTEQPLALPFAHDARIVVYGDDEKEATDVASRLREQGFQNAAILEGGFDAYRSAGLPTEEITQQQPVPGSESGIPRI
jgi:rhodanese-related sulfurtransferase